MTKFPSHYESLNVTRDAPPEVIRAAYRSLSQKHHPDKNTGSHEAAQMMMRLNAAYSVLSDPDQRRLYDLQMLEEQFARAAHFDMPEEAPKRPVEALLHSLRNYANGRDLRIAAALLGSFAIALMAVMWSAWNDNQASLRLERAAFYGPAPDLGSPAAAPSQLPVARDTAAAKVAEQRSKPAAAPKPPAAPAATSKASEYERLTAMLKSMGFGLHKLDAPAPASNDTAPRLPAKTADASKEIAASAPPPAPVAKASASPDTGRAREEIASTAPAEPARGDVKPAAAVSQAIAAPAASANTASASRAPRNAVFADARACPTPTYPINAFRNGESGTVLLALLIGNDGRVMESKVQKSSGSPELDKAARKALSLCKFKPAGGDGQAEPTWANISYVWSID
jgi:TonB family protein